MWRSLWTRSPTSNDTQNTYVILGNGCAGVNAAEAIRERDKTGRILLISNEGPAYQRPMLTKAMLSGLDRGADGAPPRRLV